MILTKYETNKILNNIKERPYNTILKLIYIYGQKSKNIINLTTENINLSENTITINNKNYPIIPSIKKELTIIIEDKKPTEKIFEEYHQLETLTHKLNTVLHQNHTCHKPVTTETLRTLRGQHLLSDGVPLPVIHELYNNKNIKQTIQIIYNKQEVKLNTIFQQYTDLDVYQDTGYLKNNDYYITYNDNEAILTYDKNNIAISGDLVMQQKIKSIASLQDYLDSLQEVGEYKVIKDIHIMKL